MVGPYIEQLSELPPAIAVSIALGVVATLTTPAKPTMKDSSFSIEKTSESQVKQAARV